MKVDGFSWLIAAVALMMAACGRVHADGPDGHDAEAGVPIDAQADSERCFGAAPFTMCLASPPEGTRTIAEPTTLETESSPMCAAVTSGDANYCVIAAVDIHISAALRGTGSKPLVLIARDSIVVTVTGAIDVGSHRGALTETGAGADAYPACEDGTVPDSASDTGGGGAGGSFAGIGGHGGDGGADPGGPDRAGGPGGAGGEPGPVVVSVNRLRGGCPGQPGDGVGNTKGVPGHSGGAVLLIAGSSIDNQGTITATGEGGAGGGAGAGAGQPAAGGGGGGSGGMIILDAPMVTNTGLVVANGGAGGQGGESNYGRGGANGADAETKAVALGGSSDGHGGDGGDGSTGRTVDGGTGNRGAEHTELIFRGGGGGGGGGAGLIKAPASAVLGTNVSPTPTP